jgi:hypothetical protein
MTKQHIVTFNAEGKGQTIHDHPSYEECQTDADEDKKVVSHGELLFEIDWEDDVVDAKSLDEKYCKHCLKYGKRVG